MIPILESFGIKVNYGSVELQKALGGLSDQKLQIVFTCRDNFDEQSKNHCNNWINIQVIMYYTTIKELKSKLLEITTLELSQLIREYLEVIDVDKTRKQVYIKIKTSDNVDELGQEYKYYLMGKIDGTANTFLLDLSSTIEEYGSPFKNIEKIYRYSLPELYRSRSTKTAKDGKKTTEENLDCGMKRVMIGAFFCSLTTTKLRKKRARYRDYGRKTIGSISHPWCIFNPQKRGHGVIIKAGSSTYDRYCGKVDVGYYEFELTNSSKLLIGCKSILESFTSKIAHDIL